MDEGRRRSCRSDPSVGESASGHSILCRRAESREPQTILDELDTLLSLLSLPLASAPVRRLPLPPRELAKLGPNSSASAGRAAFLFVPLLADEPALAGWFLVFELFEDGIRAALMSTAERSDQLGHWSEVLEVGWLGAGAQPEAVAEGRGEASGKGANLGYEVKSETIRTLWWLCVYVLSPV